MTDTAPTLRTIALAAEAEGQARNVTSARQYREKCTELRAILLFTSQI
jgi:hypothetical protein